MYYVYTAIYFFRFYHNKNKNSILFYEFICVLFWRVLISKRAAGNLIVSQALAMIKHIL